MLHLYPNAATPDNRELMLDLRRHTRNGRKTNVRTDIRNVLDFSKKIQKLSAAKDIALSRPYSP